MSDELSDLLLAAPLIAECGMRKAAGRCRIVDLAFDAGPSPVAGFRDKAGCRAVILILALTPVTLRRR